MQRFIVLAALLLPCAFAQAQTTIKITMPDSTSCTYSTGQVASNATPGQLQATSSTFGTGTGCNGGGGNTGGVSFGPAALLAPTSASVGPSAASQPFTFQAINATSCTGTITGNGGGTFSNGTASMTLCSSSTNPTCAAAQLFSVAFPANNGQTDLNNSVKVSCSGTTGAPVEQTAAVLVSHTPIQGNCRQISNGGSGVFAQWTGNHLVNYGGQGNRSVDVTNFDSIFSSAWPGSYGQIATFSLPTSSYISAAFTVPANFMTAVNAPNPLYGEYSIGETGTSGLIAMTISTTCGDFSNPSSSGSTVVPGCYLNGGGAGFLISWNKTGSSCVLTGSPGKYFLNIINANIANVTPLGGTATSTANAKCGGGTCSDPIDNGPGTWQGYIPN
jgi:hypothetical protein